MSDLHFSLSQSHRSDNNMAGPPKGHALATERPCICQPSGAPDADERGLRWAPPCCRATANLFGYLISFREPRKFSTQCHVGALDLFQSSLWGVFLQRPQRSPPPGSTLFFQVLYHVCLCLNCVHGYNDARITLGVCSLPAPHLRPRDQTRVIRQPAALPMGPSHLRLSPTNIPEVVWGVMTDLEPWSSYLYLPSLGFLVHHRVPCVFVFDCWLPPGVWVGTPHPFVMWWKAHCFIFSCSKEEKAQLYCMIASGVLDFMLWYS